MQGLDTNVLVRYIVQDDITQSRIATDYIEKSCTIDNPGFINGIVMCELVWVLETAYEYSRTEITPVLEKILKVKQFHIHEASILWKAFYEYKKKASDFADNYIGQINLHYGCDVTLTFDKKAGRLQGFRYID